MAQEVDFRLAQPTDAVKLLELLKVAKTESRTVFFDDDLDTMTPTFLQTQIEMINSSRNNVILIATYDDNPIGVVTVFQDDNQATGELGVVVLNEFQGFAIGTNLVEMAIEWAQDFSKLDSLWLTVFQENAVAIHVYQKAGFEMTAEMLMDQRPAFKMQLSI